MGKIVSVVGNTGAGKTTLVRALCTAGGFTSGLEQHSERPFQRLFKEDARYALANQMDYLLYRARQEQDLRAMSGVGLIDGGLDLDFHGFTRLFFARGMLSEKEFCLCENLYSFFRSLLPFPDLIVHLTADRNLLIHRLSLRNRINIVTPADLELMESLIQSWIDTIPPDMILTIETSGEDTSFSKTIPIILDKIASLTIK
jgi:deoxyadenosine/deoxycytidine kinase